MIQRPPGVRAAWTNTTPGTGDSAGSTGSMTMNGRPSGPSFAAMSAPSTSVMLWRLTCRVTASCEVRIRQSVGPPVALTSTSPTVPPAMS